VTNCLAVETNWIIDVALERNQASLRIWELAKNKQVTLYLPSPSLTESLKVLQESQGELKGIEQTIRQENNKFTSKMGLRATRGILDEVLTHVAQTQDRYQKQFWKATEEISSTVQLLNPSASTISEAGEIGDLLNLKPVDAMVLALITSASRLDQCHDFMSRDQDFSKGRTVSWMKSRNITFHDSPSDYLKHARRLGSLS